VAWAIGFNSLYKIFIYLVVFLSFAYIVCIYFDLNHVIQFSNMLSNQTIHGIGVALLIITLLFLMVISVREMFDDKAT